MTETPFSTTIRCYSPNGKKEVLTFTNLLRTVPGRRDVYEALWGKQCVIAKVFSRGLGGKRHLMREWKGLLILQKRNINSPVPLFWGKTEEGQWLVAEQKISDSEAALDLYTAALQNHGHYEILAKICIEMAREHENGVFQADFHLNNFLVAGNNVFALDPGQMRFFSRAVSRKKGLTQLAMLLCYLSDDDAKSISGLYECYLDARGWTVNVCERDLLVRERDLCRNRIAQRGLKKTLRTGRRYLEIHSDQVVAVFDRDLYLGADPKDLINRIEAQINYEGILKDGHTCHVSNFHWNDRHLVVKRYNFKGIFFALRHTLKKSRARRAWLHGHRLFALNIQTPKPLGFIEAYKGFLLYRSYLITEYVEGKKLNEILKDPQLSEEQRKIVILRTMEMLKRLWKYSISHGDLKHSNIIIGANGPMLIDLDSMVSHKCKIFFGRKKKKDEHRFTLGFDR